MGKRSAYIILVGKYERKRPYSRHMCVWEDAIKIDFKPVSTCVCRLDSCGLRSAPVADPSEYGNKPSNFVKGREFLYQLNSY